MQEVYVMPRIGFVHGYVAQRGIVEAPQPFFLLGVGPIFLYGSYIVVRFRGLPLEGSWRVHECEPPAQELGGLLYLAAHLRRYRYQVLIDEKLPDLLQHAGRIGDETRLRRVVVRYGGRNLAHVLARVDKPRCL